MFIVEVNFMVVAPASATTTKFTLIMNAYTSSPLPMYIGRGARGEGAWDGHGMVPATTMLFPVTMTTMRSSPLPL